MNNDKSKFELASKIIGLILIVIGIYQAFDAIALWINLGDKTDIYRQMGISKEYLGIVKQFDEAMNFVFKDLAVKLLLLSLFPIVLGCYLMKPNNIFCRFTYPDNDYTLVESNSSNNLETPAEEENFDYKPFSMGNSL